MLIIQKNSFGLVLYEKEKEITIIDKNNDINAKKKSRNYLDQRTSYNKSRSIRKSFKNEKENENLSIDKKFKQSYKSL